ncbi:hypothetical protein HDU93_006424 [Gonapodya sp. JEL0774]|nr:hypothetical protein HDU93_006424 [Gonapodya sp. JEL0774]
MTSLMGLPDEILVHVLHYVSITALCRFAVTCYRAHTISRDSRFYLNLDLSPLRPIVDDSRLFLLGSTQFSAIIPGRPHDDQSFGYIRSLSLAYCSNITDEGLITLSLFAPGGLKELDLSECDKITDAGVSSICLAAPRLKTLRLSRIGGVTDAGVAKWSASASGLEELDVSWTQLTSSGLDILTTRCTKLRTLIMDCTDVSDRGLELLAIRGRMLSRVSVAACEGVTERTLDFLDDLWTDRRLSEFKDRHSTLQLISTYSRPPQIYESNVFGDESDNSVVIGFAGAA